MSGLHVELIHMPDPAMYDEVFGFLLIRHVCPVPNLPATSVVVILFYVMLFYYM
jgi:hypothetical protein